ncbi:hypothetical protein PINS_up011169 [Pythium insidiosum]|nr:hypothetical protein PINS_up011169 [Pythium insidiosum]
MTISSRVTQELFEAAQDGSRRRLIRLPPTSTKEGGVVVASDVAPRGVVRTWTRAEHERFLRGLELFPKGPWKKVAEYVATKTTRQTMAHAQKYRQRIARQRTRLLSSNAGHDAAAAESAAATDNQSTERFAESDDEFEDDANDDEEVEEEEEEEGDDNNSDAFFQTEILPLLLPDAETAEPPAPAPVPPPPPPLEPLPLSSFPEYTPLPRNHGRQYPHG